MGDVHPVLRQGLADVASHVLVPHAGEHGAPDAEPRGADDYVRGAAANVLAERLDVLQPRPVLFGVEVD